MAVASAKIAPPQSRLPPAWVVALVLVALTFAVYARVSHFEFINYDDPDYILNNPHVRAGLSGEGAAWAFGRLHGQHTYWHPVTWLSHMLDCQFFGVQAGAHHLVNLFFHCANAVLLFLVLKRLTGALWPSATVAALFALHPLQIETVAWISERKNLLSGLFWMLTLCAYARYAERPQLRRYWPVPSLFALGLMCKPAVVTLPLVLLLLDIWPLRRLRLVGLPPIDMENPPTSLGCLLLEKLPLILLSVVSCGVTILAHEAIGMGAQVHKLPVLYRVENALVAYVRYLGKAIWPGDLSIIYLHPGVWPTVTVLASGAVLLLISMWVYRQARRQPWLLVGWLWFLGALLPTIGLMQVGVQAMAGRFVYLPVVGLFIMVVWGGAELTRDRTRHRRVLGLAGGLAVAGCAVTTSFHLKHWRDSIAVFTEALRVNPNNYIAHNNLAFALAQTGRTEEATKHVSEALRIKPDLAEAHFQAGLILEMQQKPAEAVSHYEEAARLEKAWSTPLLFAGNALVRLGRTTEALARYSAALQADPDDADAHFQLADALTAQHRAAEAIKHYRAALCLRPDWPEALNNLAWLLATQPDAQLRNGGEAVRLAERAVALTQRRQTIFIGTLAAAYAEAGRFDHAVSTAEEACSLAQAAGNRALADRNRALLENYRAGRSYRDVQ